MGIRMISCTRSGAPIEPMESLLPALSALAIGAPAKRKVRDGHYGLREDSTTVLMLVAISRLAQTRDEGILQTASVSPVGVSLLALLKEAVVRVAVGVGGAASSFNAQSATTLFGLSGSTVASRARYDSGVSLPDKLSWERGRALVGAMLDSLNVVRLTEIGARVGMLLLQIPSAPLDAAANAAVIALIASVESDMQNRLGGGSSGGSRGSSGGSSLASDRSTPPPELPMAVAVPVPSEIDASATLGHNAKRLLEARLSRLLSPAEGARVDEALTEALSVLQAGGDGEIRRLLAVPIGGALLHPGAAQLWACAVDAAEVASSVAMFYSTVNNTASTIAGALFASALIL